MDRLVNTPDKPGNAAGKRPGADALFLGCMGQPARRVAESVGRTRNLLGLCRAELSEISLLLGGADGDAQAQAALIQAMRRINDLEGLMTELVRVHIRPYMDGGA